jgi:hypothetical protein
MSTGTIPNTSNIPETLARAKGSNCYPPGRREGLYSETLAELSGEMLGHLEPQ